MVCAAKPREQPVREGEDAEHQTRSHREKINGYFVCLIYLLGTISSLPPAGAITGNISALGSTLRSLITDRTPGKLRAISSAAAFCWSFCTVPFRCTTPRRGYTPIGNSRVRGSFPKARARSAANLLSLIRLFLISNRPATPDT